MKKLINTVLLFFCVSIYAQDIGGDYYVATDGNDNNPGTYEQPWGTWQKAFDTAKPGDTVYFRGGIYRPTSSAAGNNITYIIEIDTITTTTKRRENGWRCFFAYPGEEPVLDCSLVDTEGKNFNTGLLLQSVHFVHFKGLTIRNVWQKYDFVTAGGIGSSRGSNHIYENMKVHNIAGPAFTFQGRVGRYGIEYDSTYFLNCDAFNNCDTMLQRGANPENPQRGGLADGWKYDNYPGAYVKWYGCRAWNCSDDGFNATGSGITVFEKCWAFLNGGPSTAPGEGNGWKGGAVRHDVPDTTLILVNNISAFNRYSFALLDYPPYFRMKSKIYNNISYANYRGFTNQWGNKNPAQDIFRNNIVYKDTTGMNMACAMSSNNNINIIESYPFFNNSIEISDSDFISLDVNELKRDRNQDGSLPEVDFMKLAPGSKLIDAGADVGLPYHGVAPDIGAFEYNYQPGTSNQYPEIRIIAPTHGNVLSATDHLQIEVSTSDPDGTIKLVEFYTGTSKIGESLSEPWTFNWSESVVGSHFLRATATDNNGARSTSSAIRVIIEPYISEFENSLIYPNPNDGKFTFYLSKSYSVSSIINIISLDGKIIHQDHLLQNEVIKQFDISRTGPGFYILAIYNDENFLSKKFIMQ